MDSLRDQARIALEAKAGAERGLAAAVACPPWRHAAFGGLMGALIATPAVPLGPRYAVFAAILLGIGLVARSDRRRLGVFINGYRRGRTRVVTLGLLAVELALYALSFNRGVVHHDTFAPLLLAIVGVAVGAVGSVVWQRVFKRELAG